jgi:hypothetical protein
VRANYFFPERAAAGFVARVARLMRACSGGDWRFRPDIANLPVFTERSAISERSMASCPETPSRFAVSSTEGKLVVILAGRVMALLLSHFKVWRRLNPLRLIWAEVPSRLNDERRRAYRHLTRRVGRRKSVATCWRKCLARICLKRGTRPGAELVNWIGVDRVESDIDFLVDLDEGRSLFDLGGLLADLNDTLASEVDLVEARCLHPYIRDHVLAEAVPL